MPLGIGADQLSGAQRVGKTLLRPLGDGLRAILLPLVPRAVQTWHLTWLTLPLGLLTVVAGWRVPGNVQWIWVISTAVVVQYVADILDGEVGRSRGSGLIRWGFYVDHLSDALFISALVVAYVPIYPESTWLLIGILIMANALFLHEALACICTGSYNTYGHHGFGLEEGRALILLVNLIIALFYPAWLHWLFVGIFVLLVALFMEQAFRTQRRLWVAEREKPIAAA